MNVWKATEEKTAKISCCVSKGDDPVIMVAASGETDSRSVSVRTAIVDLSAIAETQLMVRYNT